MVNRDRHDITMEILRKATSVKRKTELMRDVGLSYVQAKQYLSALTEKGLLEMDEQNRYKTTGKGLEILEKCMECPLFKWKRTA
ncbi:MAG: winged helix-turn-helix domain-containing protein [Candidatus Bathyarchaeota archaeon]|nr:winged helix-turn-helix domain-containing protein [Candidatus Bathyarchaeota archaeon]MDI6805864.1 winged helix-turn-helix domain-containing protein [Candidatus Bathyarchaeia archaeon]